MHHACRPVTMQDGPPTSDLCFKVRLRNSISRHILTAGIGHRSVVALSSFAVVMRLRWMFNGWINTAGDWFFVRAGQWHGPLYSVLSRGLCQWPICARHEWAVREWAAAQVLSYNLFLTPSSHRLTVQYVDRIQDALYAQMFDRLHLKGPATDKWPPWSFIRDINP